MEVERKAFFFPALHLLSELHTTHTTDLEADFWMEGVTYWTEWIPSSGRQSHQRNALHLFFCVWGIIVICIKIFFKMFFQTTTTKTQWLWPLLPWMVAVRALSGVVAHQQHSCSKITVLPKHLSWSRLRKHCHSKALHVCRPWRETSGWIKYFMVFCP